MGGVLGLRHGKRLMLGPFAYGWKFLAAAVLLIGAWGFGFNHGSNSVQQKWDKETASVATALAQNAIHAREKEQALQDSMNGIQRDATEKAEALQAAATSAADTAGRLRQQVNKLLAADKAAGTCTSRTATENPGNLLAVVLDKSVTRNRELAAFADLAMNAAKACAVGYEKARN